MLAHEQILRLLLLGSALLSFAACSTADRSIQLSIESAAPFSAGGSGPVLNDQWWVAFEDQGLTAAIGRALEQNFSLTAAYERMRAAQMLALRQSANLLPQLDLLGVAERSEVWRSGDWNSDSSVSVGLAASYELDFWGRLNAQTDAANLRAEASEAFLQSAAISISAEVALAWYRLAAAQEQKLVLLEQVETNRTVLEILDERFKSGQIRAADVLRQRQLIEATLEDVNDSNAQIAVIEHLLAILQGDTPQGGEGYPDAALVKLPPAPLVGLPSELLQRRPDVREALLNIQASNADLAAAVSDRYPRVNLSASVVTSDGEFSLFDDWLASIAGQIAAPVIDGGARRAEVLRNEALLNQQVADYGQTVLQAFREVEDALALEYHQCIKIAQLETQLELADETYRQLRTQYLNGVADYIEVLDTLTAQQFLARSLVTARLDLIEFRIALHRALAGGFYPTAEVGATQSKVEINNDV